MTQLDWKFLLTSHDRWLRTVVLARVGQRSAVDEVMQEIALAAVKQQSPIRNQADVAPWLYRLAVWQSLLFRRRQGRCRKLNDGYFERIGRFADNGLATDPFDWLVERERRWLLRRAMDQLKRRDAEILLLKYTEDWTYREISDHLGISQSAVEARLHRARARLRARLAMLEPVADTPR
jgi:RNA polymerase sigma-70 factor (ECF subfamily)